MKKIAVFASGSGSDFQSVIDANERDPFCEISLLVASKEGIYALERAKKHGIDTLVRRKKDFSSLEEMYEDTAKILKERGVDYIVLAGWLSMISENFVRAFPDRIINIHPSLIPSFCGKGFYGINVHRTALEYGVKLSGLTVHFVDEHYDSGAIILQRAVEVKEDDTPESLQSRILEEEHKALPEAVRLLTQGRIIKNGRKVTII
ncbi:MAG TPA: phosphoribosylglycinamide formyltransferase [Candidatus Borkfalkia excrementavium]|uniref:Phosphoribosylglycinamide formyltransferase n=1 Tax=Candidatus Borkfalkia excrementavium TaxID=2838505 RepID=A0A9D2CEN1_9FIRM|nr:phosphoribosylglycinamide formyltransferase [Candidatus Borkfalkia excrementavium]